jgi:EpsI family protein
MIGRLSVLSACFLLSAGYVGYAMEPEEVPLRQPFSQMPDQTGRWIGRPGQPLTESVLNILGVDDHVNRIYYASPSEAAALYVGYYQSQREGDTIHSPMNCLPGSGWLPVATSYAGVTVPGRTSPITVKRVLIEKGLDRQVVLYWYQSHGRVIGNEYWSKVVMVYDAVRLNRSDAALVRVVTPITAQGEAAADRLAVEFVQTIFPQLERHLPS